MNDFNIYDAGDVFDSREVIERLEALEGEEFASLSEDEKQELNDLREFAAKGEMLDDWHFGVTFIADDHFTAYAMEFAYEVGAVPDTEAPWPLSYIDWDAAADALQSDYTDFEVGWFTYWAR